MGYSFALQTQSTFNVEFFRLYKIIVNVLLNGCFCFVVENGCFFILSKFLIFVWILLIFLQI